AGIVYPDIFQTDNLIQPMLATMQHTDSQSADVYNYKHIQIGICGSKLEANENKTIFLGMDGDHDNQDTLRKQLENNGTPLSENTSPLEIILKAYEILDLDFLKYISGNFALVIL